MVLGADVTAINTAVSDANLKTKLDDIKTKTNTIPDTLGADVTAIKTKTDKITDTLGADVTAIKAKTDNMPADLTANLTTIKTETDKITDIKTNVGAIKTKTDNMPDNLENVLALLATSASLLTLDGKVETIKTETDKITDIKTNVGEIKTKTDKMPADLTNELTNLSTIATALNGDGQVHKAVTFVLENSFKQAIEKAGTKGSDWLENSVTKIISQPVFDIPATDDAALNWSL